MSYCRSMKSCMVVLDSSKFVYTWGKGQYVCIWATEARWSGDHSSERSMHSATSSRVVQVLPMRGSAEAEQDLRPILTVHGFVMSPCMGSRISKSSWKWWLTLKLPESNMQIRNSIQIHLQPLPEPLLLYLLELQPPTSAMQS